MKRISIIVMIVCTLGSCSDNTVNVLILSGSNNHEWQSTTPLIREILLGNGQFTVDVTERPDTISTSMLRNYDVIVSNWNAYPAQHNLWNPKTKQAIEDFVNQGGGFVCIHGASATHYDWPAYIEIVGGTWGDNTSHGPVSECTVQIIQPDHPITKGLQNFTIRDELWVDLACSPSIEVLCAAQSEKHKDTPGKLEPVVIITRYGKGRGFYHVLGHDISAMSHPDWKTLLIRGTKWAAN